MTSLDRPDDELANLITHGLGFLLSLVAAVYLMDQAAHQAAGLVVACGVYSAALMLVYGASTLSHLFYDLQLRRRFRTIDQACIFLLISGSYTPFAMKYLDHGHWRWVLFGMWGLAIAGIVRVFKVGNMSRTDKYLYGLLGVLPAITLPVLFRQAPWGVVSGIIAGGICYGLGAPFLRLSSSYRYAHAAWHLFVVAGSACHYVAILLAVSRS